MHLEAHTPAVICRLRARLCQQRTLSHSGALLLRTHALTQQRRDRQRPLVARRGATQQEATRLELDTALRPRADLPVRHSERRGVWEDVHASDAGPKSLREKMLWAQASVLAHDQRALL